MNEVTKSVILARMNARGFSNRYMTSWYVEQLEDGRYVPMAHASDTERTVSWFFCGEEWTTEEQRANLEASKLKRA